MEKKKSLTTGEVAKLCDVSIPTIHKWIREERIKCFKMPGSGKLRIPREQVYQFMKSYGFPIEEGTQNKNILLILNPDNYSQKFSDVVVQYHDYSCHIVNDIFGAGMYTTSQIPDAIFIDLSVLGVDPESFCKNIVQSINNDKMTIVAVSKAFSTSQQNKLKKCGFSDFLELPLKAVTFKKKLSSLF